MGVPVESVAVGKCYVTEIGQVRRVLEIKNAIVKYESRGKTAHGGSWGALYRNKHSQVCQGCRTRSPMRLRSTPKVKNPDALGAVRREIEEDWGR